MSCDILDNASDLDESLGTRIGLKRLGDVLPDDDYVLHVSRWWRVLGETGQGLALELLLAGPDDPREAETSILVGDAGDLVITTPVSSGLQFQDGKLLDVPWPRCGLIYVKNARMRGIGSDPDEQVFGIFALRYDADGSPYYAPVDQEFQPGVASDWLLDPGLDLILDWEPVDVADLLERMQKEHG